MKCNYTISRKVFILLVLAVGILSLAAPRGAGAAEMLRNIVVEKTKNLFPPTEKGYRFRCPVFGRCNHRIVGMFMTERRGIPEAWVLAAVPNESDCHSCMSRLTLEVYRKQQGRWEKYRVWRDFDEAGGWGVVNPEFVRMAKIDDRRMVLFIEGGFTNMGQTMGYMSIYVIDDEDITPAREFCLHYDNEGEEIPGKKIKRFYWNASYRLGTVKGRPALIFHIKGKGKDDDNTVIYEFMGKGLRVNRDSYPDPRLRFPCGG